MVGRSSARILPLLILLAVLGLAGYVRFSNIGAMSLWEDELRQLASHFETNWKLLIYRAAGDGQLPLDYWLGSLVFRIEVSDVAARMPAAILGTASIFLAYLLARRVVSRGLAVGVALALACSPYHIHYSLEARPYAIYWFLMLLTLLLWRRAWERNRWRDWVLLLMVLGPLQISRALDPFLFTGMMGLWALAAVWRDWRKRNVARWYQWRGLRLSGCLVMVWAPSLYLLAHVIHIARRGLQANVQVATAGERLQAMALKVGESVAAAYYPSAWLLVPLGLVGLVWMWRRASATRNEVQRMVLAPAWGAWMLHLVVFVLMVSADPKPVYWCYMLPFFWIGIAYVVQQLIERWPLMRSAGIRTVGGAIIAVLLLGQLQVDRRAVVFNKSDWRGSLTWLMNHTSPQDTILYTMEGIYNTYKFSFMDPGVYWRGREQIPTVISHLPTDWSAIFAQPAGRVGLLLRNNQELILSGSTPIQDWPDLDEIAPGVAEKFEILDFQFFRVLVSRQPYEQVAEGVVEACDALLKIYGEERPEWIDLHVARLHALLHLQRRDEACRALPKVIRLVPAGVRGRFLKDHQDLVLACQ